VLRGIHWQFLRLVDNLVSLDLDQYYIKELGKILVVSLSLRDEVGQ
jgi:hypothetical protein